MSKKIINVVVNSNSEFEYIDVSSAELEEFVFEFFVLLKAKTEGINVIVSPFMIVESQSEIFAVAWNPNLKVYCNNKIYTLKELLSVREPDIIASIDTLPRITKEEFYTI